MDALWPWFAVAGAGALHGLNPMAGWGPAVALALGGGDRGGDRGGDAGARRLLPALGPIAAGHLVSVVLTAMAVARGIDGGRAWLAGLAVVAFLVVALRHARHRSTASRARLSRWGLGLWSFVAATAHGAGMMLLPALAPLCLGTAVGRELTASGSVSIALLVVAVHAVAMLLTGAAVGFAAARGVGVAARLLRRRRARPAAPPAAPRRSA